MPNKQETLNLLQSSQTRQLFAKMYDKQEAVVTAQIERYTKLIYGFTDQFQDTDMELFSSPGRSEIGGNHTDHNYGKVLTASINLDSIAAASRSNDGNISIYSEGYPESFIISLNELDKKQDEGGTTALIRGIAAGFVKFGYEVGGFQASMSSTVINASGLSSSASIEMLICTILNTFYNQGKLDTVIQARIGQYAENVYWDKPSGLLDQMACGSGGLVSIDFQDPKNPQIESIDFDFAKQDHSLIIVNTGTNHADLTDEYAAVPNEMTSVARALGGKVCRDISLDQVLDNMIQLREKLSDRALLRAMHFFAENQRVEEQAEALKSDNFPQFLKLITESGNSSWKLLQNCYIGTVPSEQGVCITLGITEAFLKQIRAGACRVHGGGFAGGILVFLPNKDIPDYLNLMEKTLGANSIYVISIREYGSVHINGLLS